MPIRSPLPNLEIPEISFHDYIFSCIRKHGKDTAIVSYVLLSFINDWIIFPTFPQIDNGSGQSLTFKQIYSNSRKLASALFQRGLKKGEVLGLCSPSCVEYVLVLLATSSCGAVLTTCNPDFTVGMRVINSAI